MYGPLAGFCDNDNEILISIKSEDYLDLLSDYWLLKYGLVPCSNKSASKNSVATFTFRQVEWHLSRSFVYRSINQIWRSGDRASWLIFIIKQTRCTNFSNLFLELNSTCFGQFLCPSSGIFHCIHSNGICHTGLLTACERDQDGTCLVLLLNSCTKHGEFHYKNKFEKLVHLVGFIIRMYMSVSLGLVVTNLSFISYSYLQ